LSLLPKEVLDLIITHFNFYTLPTDHFLYKECESAADSMFIILDGSIVSYSGFEEVQRLESPCIVGEEALLFNHMRSHSVASLSELKVCGLQRKKFQELVRFISP
jgi:CRP-like cAMP-binding protein